MTGTKARKYCFAGLLSAVSLFAVITFLPRAAGAQSAGDWYRGDLHSHSLHSDGDSLVADVLANAQVRGLEFFVITDHDTDMNGTPTHWDDPDYVSEKMVLLYGVEWTSEKGHANVWSAEPFDYDALWEANRDLDAHGAVDAAHEQDALFSINHPAAFVCCPWEYTVPEGVDCVEVWNAMYRLPNFNRHAGHTFWETILQSGRRMPAVGGSDNHQVAGFQSYFNPHGNPTTWVFAEDKTAEAILAGIKAGHASISYAPYAPRLELSADADVDGVFEIMAGDDIEEAGKVVSFKVELHDPGLKEKGIFGSRLYRAVVYKDGKIFKNQIMSRKKNMFTFRDTPGRLSYYRVELHGYTEVGALQHSMYGSLVAMTNPVYIAFENK